MAMIYYRSLNLLFSRNEIPVKKPTIRQIIFRTRRLSSLLNPIVHTMAIQTKYVSNETVINEARKPLGRAYLPFELSVFSPVLLNTGIAKTSCEGE